MSDFYQLRKDADYLAELSQASLLRFHANAYSECGQAGILRAIFRRCGLASGRFVEFGAWDGCHLSNCRALALRGWNGVSIECEPERFKTLQANLPAGSTAICARVGDGQDQDATLESILETHDVTPSSVDFLSIDVDGLDLEIFESLTMRPAVVLVEGGFNYNPQITHKAPRDYAAQNNQHPLGAVISSARLRGYEAVCFFQDTYLVRSDLAHGFQEQIALGAEGLFMDAWIFASPTARDYLMNLRRTDSKLQAFEIDQTGYCLADPTKAAD